MTAPVALLPDTTIRLRVRVRGVVQGVGFRPFVYRLARGSGLAGNVGNDDEGVVLEVEGPTDAVDDFLRGLVSAPPPLARIDAVESTSIAPVGEARFRIVESHGSSGGRTFMAPDVAVCDDCRREMSDPTDRRYRYPFVNCTNCGPRFTITERLPYDRPNTTMRAFALCPACAAEYTDPADRRFHAQPVACAVCGPRLWFEGAQGVVAGTDAALAAAHQALHSGAVLAVKGLGGYHLACDPRADAVVARLRERKRRPAKPFAVMVRDLDVARRLACLDDEAALLSAPQRPIVLLRRRADDGLSTLVAPAQPLVGILLPYTPLHHLLFEPVPGSNSGAPDALVMTSGNLSDEPICFEDADARTRLAPLVDGWLLHDRPIHVPCDDSVLRMVDGAELPIRRSRGYAPLAMRLPFEVAPSLAVGGELKNAFCLAAGRDAWMSQHIGDMGSLETMAAFDRSVAQFCEVYGIDPELVVADAHPGYQTRRWAERQSEHPVALVQHHYAHVVSVMLEHRVVPDTTVVGFAFDGTGYGTDGAVWGGEVLLADYDGFSRVAHLRSVLMPGGDATVRQPARIALAYLRSAALAWDPRLAPVAATPADELRALDRQLERGMGCVRTSSVGRLFDAASALLGVCQRASYEAQAAIELETIAAPCVESARNYAFGLGDGVIDPAPVLAGMIRDVTAGVDVGSIAAGFHVALAAAIVDIAEGQRASYGVTTVALSGGVFQNVVLLRLTRASLGARGFDVLTHRLVPPNDGGLALGQLVAARVRTDNERACP